MNKLISFAAFAGLMVSSGFLASCKDDGKDPEIPVTDLSLSEWTFSPSSHEDICIGEIRTKDDNPEINAGSTNEYIGITYARMPQKENGLNIYKILASVAERTVPASVSSVVEVEVVGKTDERIYKKVKIGQYGLVSGLDNNTLAGVYRLGEIRELDADDGDLEIKTLGIAAELSVLPDGTITIAGVKGTDDFRNGTFNYTLNGNQLKIGNEVYTIAYYADDTQSRTMVLERVEHDNLRVDEYDQYYFQARD